ncbi:hypothetical protein GGI12_005125 [Dipsacomyces acuminosporus]|nr:hypothetical protein GGI12_005125 [Dipsacomyces acuminosporus]
MESEYSIVYMFEDAVLKVRKSSTPKEVFVNEVKAIGYVREHLDIPVPELYSYSENHIYMSRVEGEILEHAWHTYDLDTKKQVMKELEGYVMQMWNTEDTEVRSFAGPTLEFGTLAYDRWEREYPRGPYSSIRDYYSAYLIKEGIEDDSSDSDNQQKIRLRHGDLEGRNILVKNGHITGIIDWALAGFYPESGFWHDPEFLGEDDYLLDPIIEQIILPIELDRRYNNVTFGNLIENLPDTDSEDENKAGD